MPYATQQDLVDRYGADEIRAVSDRADPPLDAIDAAVVAKALADAGEEIDGYLAKRYALPIAGTVPPVLTMLACEIARFRLQRSIPSEDLTNGYTRAIKRLQEIAAGQFVLQLAGTEPAGAGQATAEIEVPPRLFTRDTMTGF